MLDKQRQHLCHISTLYRAGIELTVRVCSSSTLSINIVGIGIKDSLPA